MISRFLWVAVLQKNHGQVDPRLCKLRIQRDRLSKRSLRGDVIACRGLCLSQCVVRVGFPGEKPYSLLEVQDRGGIISAFGQKAAEKQASVAISWIDLDE